MATSEVKRVIEPEKTVFERGTIVMHVEYGPILIGVGCSSDAIYGTRLSGEGIGISGPYLKERCRLFKGSVTLTEG